MKKTICMLFGMSLFLGCQQGEVTPQTVLVTIDPSDLSLTETQLESYRLRRDRVIAALGEGVILLRSSDTESHNRHRFRPNNYFYYLTGNPIPGAMMVLGEGSKDTFTLIMPRETARTLIYEGGNPPVEKVKALYRADQVLEYEEGNALLKEILAAGNLVYTDLSDRLFLDDLTQSTGIAIGAGISHIGELVDEMRVIKDPGEIGLLQKACDITAQSLVNVMRECRPGRYEFEMESIIEGTFLAYGSAMPGFASIVGSGPNSTILHYEANDRQMEHGDLLLMDIGAEYGYYTADMTRTIPVSGYFTPEQEAIYSLVLEAQKAAIEQLKPGNRIGDGHTAASRVILEGLEGLGLVTDRNALWQQRFYILYPSSHYLGLDVHDVGDYGGFFANQRVHPTVEGHESRVLEPGMVLTIEPGLYFREKGMEQVLELFRSEADSSDIADFVNRVSPVYEQYVNIGVRIEDDILITDDGNLVLSRHAPKEIPEIETLMK